MITKRQANRLRGLANYACETAQDAGTAVGSHASFHAAMEHRIAKDRLLDAINKLTEKAK